MALHRAKGARLGWLLFPGERAVEIGRAAAEGEAAGEAERMAMAGTPERIEAAEVLEGGEALPGSRLTIVLKGLAKSGATDGSFTSF